MLGVKIGYPIASIVKNPMFRVLNPLVNLGVNPFFSVLGQLGNQLLDTNPAEFRVHPHVQRVCFRMFQFNYSSTTSDFELMTDHLV